MEDEKIKYVTGKVGVKNTFKLLSRKGMGYIRDLYNCVCDECRIKVNENPTMPINEYCNNCQKKVKPYIDKLIKFLEK